MLPLHSLEGKEEKAHLGGMGVKTEKTEFFLIRDQTYAYIESMCVHSVIHCMSLNKARPGRIGCDLKVSLGF